MKEKRNKKNKQIEKHSLDKINQKQRKNSENMKPILNINNKKNLIDNAYLLRILIDNAPDYIYVKDTSGRFILCNKSLVHLMGAKTENDLLNKTDFDFYPRELADKYYGDEQVIIQTGKTLLNHEEPNIDAEGNYKCDLTTKVPLRDSENNIIGILGISRDITKIKLVEETLKQERNLLRALIDNFPDHIYAKDTDGRFTLANIAVARHMGGTKPEDLIGKTDFDFYPKELAEKFYTDELKLLQSEQPILDHEEFNRDSKGKNIWTLTTKILLHDNQGKTLGLIGIGRDISERKQAQMELEKAYKELKENQQKLLIAEKLASLGRITAGIAHEMNTPLSTVQSALFQLVILINEYKMSINNPQVLPEDHLSIIDDMMKNLNLAIQAVKKSSGFIKGIKAQTYDINNKNYENFLAVPVINDTLNILGFILKKSQCTIVTDVDDSIQLFGNPRWLSQIITNLVVNAIDACKPHGGTIRISLKKTNDKNILLKIEDPGCGIPPENLSYIFDPMFTTKKFGEGTGLGLSIVHEMIKEMKGTIEVKSKPGETLFMINIPLAEESS